MFDKLLNIFREKKKEVPSSISITDYSLMAVDIHSHLIPGIDDGSKSIDDTIFLLRRLEELGFKKIITSPHVMADGYKNTSEILLQGREVVRKAIQENAINLEFDVTGEYNIDESLYEKIEKKDLLPFGKNYVMVEMPFLAKPAIMGDIMYKLQVAGYRVILAHPERYSYFHENDWHNYNALKDRSIFFQLNISSLTGKYGQAAKYTAEKLIKENMVDFLGTDLHAAGQLESLKECLSMKYLEKILTYDKLLNKTLL